MPSLLSSDQPPAPRQRSRRGLVIAGGGAKGAYAAGCLKAFRQRDIKFDAVAGTSSGALNAITWAADALEESREIWFNLSFQRVFPPALELPWPLSMLNYLWGIFRVSFGIAETVVRGLPLPPDLRQAQKIVAVIISSITASPFLLLTYILWESRFWALCTVAAYALFSWATASGYFDRSTNSVALANATFPFSFLFASMVLISSSFSSSASWTFSAHIAEVVVFIFVIYATIAVLGIAAAVSLWVYRPFARQKVFRNEPLYKEIMNILESHALQVPTYVTVAQRTDVFFPTPEYDWEGWLDDRRQSIKGGTGNTRSAGPIVPPAVDRSGIEKMLSKFDDGSLRFADMALEPPLPTLRNEWVPRYQLLNDISDPALAADYALASAAIPLGFVNEVDVDGVPFVDGGIVDNVPLLPLLQHETLDEVFVVLLDPANDKTSITEVDDLSEQRLRDLCSLTIHHAAGVPDSIGTLWARVEAARRDREPGSELIRPVLYIFCPSAQAKIGHLLSGTLNFNAKYARRVFDHGWKDTLAELDRIGISG